MGLKKKYNLRGSFVCNHCREICGGCIEELEEIGRGERIDNELFPRKQLIGCLGKYCDDPCHLQKESDLTIEHCINLIMWMGNKLNGNS